MKKNLLRPPHLPHRNPAPAQLTILRLPNGQVQISWPTVAGATLEGAAALGSPQAWAPVGGAPQVVGDTSTVVLQPTDTFLWFRLH